MAKSIICLYGFVFLISGCVSTASIAQTSSVFISCDQDLPRQKLRSQELQAIVSDDQKDRTPPVDWSQVGPRDEIRRKRVGEIFGEGCFNSASDYSAAALIYQHGTVSDHYFQAFLWSKKAFELGNSWEGHSVANGIDRYLVSTGHRQLFGTQFRQDPNTKLWCIEPIEKTFPDSKRVQYLKMSLEESIKMFLKFYKSTQLPGEIETCRRSLKPSPHGIVPGFW